VTAETPKRPTHLRRAKWSRRVQLLFALAAAAFLIYRLVEGLLHPSAPH
jgi:hypothetical protein